MDFFCIDTRGHFFPPKKRFDSMYIESNIETTAGLFCYGSRYTQDLRDDHRADIAGELLKVVETLIDPAGIQREGVGNYV